MSERIFSDLTKTVVTEAGQSPVLGDGETINYDISLAGFGPPYSIHVQSEGGANPATREVFTLGVNSSPTSLIASAPVPVAGTPVVNQLPDVAHPRLRVAVVAGTPAPTGRVRVLISGVRN